MRGWGRAKIGNLDIPALRVLTFHPDGEPLPGQHADRGLG